MDSELQSGPEVSETSESDPGLVLPVLSEGDGRDTPQIDTEVPAVAGDGAETTEPAQPAPETADQPPAADPRAGLALLARSRTLELLAALGTEDAPVRYRTLAARLGTTMLATRLRELTAAGLVVRHVDTGPPIEVSYTLSPTAAPLTGPVRDLLAWAGTYTPPGQVPHQAEPGEEELSTTETAQHPSPVASGDDRE
ncbi:winged helix-turn-helix transcriptional regulator [Parafrankia sp. FMc2]|uniref:winged helix-turn-helix transcriptional regulator n=1 Tax=Parafrankia sp. FMc2 TaxID=3233196 RepID=UPI0034D75328